MIAERSKEKLSLYGNQIRVVEYQCLLLIMAVEMGVQSAEHLLIAEMLCSNLLSLHTIHYPPFPIFTIPFEVFSCLSVFSSFLFCGGGQILAFVCNDIHQNAITLCDCDSGLT